MAKYKTAGKEFSLHCNAFDKTEPHAGAVKEDGLALHSHPLEDSLRKQNWPIPTIFETIISQDFV